MCSLSPDSQTRLIPTKLLLFKALASRSVSLEWPSLNTTQAHVKHLSGLGNHHYLQKLDISQPKWNSSPKTDHSVIIYKRYFHFWLEYSNKWLTIISFSGKCPSVNSYSTNDLSCGPDAFGITHLNSQFWKKIFGWTMIHN